MGKTSTVIILLAFAFICCCMVSVFLPEDQLQHQNNELNSLFVIIVHHFDKLFDEVIKNEREGSGFDEAHLRNLQGEKSDIALENLKHLANVEIPKRDPVDLAFRYQGKKPEDIISEQENLSIEVGERCEFWVSNSDKDRYVRVWATLKVISDHAYFWIADGVRYDKGKLFELAEVFDQKIYPNTRSFFGSEWSPGIDSDDRIYILFAKGVGTMVAGYFSSTDEEPPAVSEYSNGHELFILNPDYLRIGDQDTEQVLAHEFQHMIHWNLDRNEDTWLNEGFSELAVVINGYPGNGYDRIYRYWTDIQLNNWAMDDIETLPHYGASYLFILYFLNRFGEDVTRELIKHPENGFDSVDAVLEEENIIDDETGYVLRAEDVFSDWVIANYLNDPLVAYGQYSYPENLTLVKPEPTETVYTCPMDWQEREVSQFGVDYLDIKCVGEFILEIQGIETVMLMPVEPHSGQYMYWSNRGDESDMKLTKFFDLGDVRGAISLKYWIWYDLEENYDYVYLLASVDGKRWDILRTSHGSLSNSMGNSYGWAYNGYSKGWIEEQVDLSSYAGQQVYIRFEYITDAAVNGEGFLIDDISLSAIQYETEFEEDETDWITNGFIRVANVLPQYYAISLLDQGKEPLVKKFRMDKDYTLSIPLNIQDKDGYLVAISAITRYTRQSADYRYRIREP